MVRVDSQDDYPIRVTYLRCYRHLETRSRALYAEVSLLRDHPSVVIIDRTSNTCQERQTMGHIFDSEDVLEEVARRIE